MTAVTGFLILHFGKPASGIHNAGSLYYHNRLLERKPIALNSPIHYTQARNLISVSLIARVLHRLTLVTSCASIEEYARHSFEIDVGYDDSIRETGHDGSNLPPSWSQLVEEATKIYDRYAITRTVEALRRARRFASPAPDAGDMVYENAFLFMRDMLNLQEIHSAQVKRGDSGRIVLALKTYALSFRGAGRSHYAKKTLNILHHVQKVWPAPLRNLILNNWLINTTGRPSSWIGLDLHQEHNDLFTKNSQDDAANNESGSSTSSEEDFESGNEPEDESEGESEVQEGFADIDPTGDDPADEFFARARAITHADGAYKKGGSQPQFNDKWVLCNLFLKHPELKKCASPGWIRNHCAKRLQSKTFDLANPRQREAPNLDHPDAPRTHHAAQRVAVLYEDLALPETGDVAFQGYMRNEIFVAAMQVIFAGLE
ncbi:hypothetical protein FRC09_020301 [Ceratobasidium sp. 395]|nr:hypothetical protein FRC09_020301 [Ceratobasidium sp. 395]